MSYSYTVTDTATFTRDTRQAYCRRRSPLTSSGCRGSTVSRRTIGSTPLKQRPLSSSRKGLLDTVAYGFRKNGYWIEPTVIYTARDLMDITANDDDPGRVRPGVQISGASFHSYLTYNSAWNQLTWKQQEEFARRLPFPRTVGVEPGINGYWSRDLTYSAGGRALDRASLRSYR